MRTRISQKLIVGVGSVAVVIIGIFAYGILDAYKDHLINEVRRSAHQLSETVKSSTHYDMLLNQRESVHRIINTIGKQEGIKKVRIFNKDGAIIYSTDYLDVGQMVDKRAEACYVCHAVDRPLERLPILERTRIFLFPDSGRTLGIINPIYNEPSCWQSDCHAHQPTQKVLGVLDISMSLDDVDREIQASQRRLVVLGVVAIAGLAVAFARLRFKDAAAPRPFKVPGGTPVALLLSAMCFVTLIFSIALFLYVPGEGPQRETIIGFVVVILIGEALIRLGMFESAMRRKRAR